jgi:hypothetical protein
MELFQWKTKDTQNNVILFYSKIALMFYRLKHQNLRHLAYSKSYYYSYIALFLYLLFPLHVANIYIYVIHHKTIFIGHNTSIYHDQIIVQTIGAKIIILILENRHKFLDLKRAQL